MATVLSWQRCCHGNGVLSVDFERLFLLPARPEEFQDTPQISFADDSHAIFGATPRLKMEPLLLSPTSAIKCKRCVCLHHCSYTVHRISDCNNVSPQEPLSIFTRLWIDYVRICQLYLAAVLHIVQKLAVS